jgi:hypothetical protein
MTIAPVRRSIVVDVDREKAFDVFTARMGSWWKPEHHIAAEAFTDIVVEPRTGGRWYEVDVAGTETAWGRVLTWDRPERVVLAWQLDAQFAYDPDFVTEVEVRFTAQGDSTLVELEHRDLDRYGAAAPVVRSQLDDPNSWQGLLTAFGAAI